MNMGSTPENTAETNAGGDAQWGDEFTENNQYGKGVEQQCDESHEGLGMVDIDADGRNDVFMCEEQRTQSAFIKPLRKVNREKQARKAGSKIAINNRFSALQEAENSDIEEVDEYINTTQHKHRRIGLHVH